MGSITKHDVTGLLKTYEALAYKKPGIAKEKKLDIFRTIHFLHNFDLTKTLTVLANNLKLSDADLKHIEVDLKQLPRTYKPTFDAALAEIIVQ